LVEKLYRYCYCCGADVYTYTVELEKGVEIRCSACGLPLEREIRQTVQNLGCIMIADDDQFYRSLLADLLKEQGLTADPILCKNGIEFLSKAAERLHGGVSIHLAILDIVMEPLDGMATAFAFRAVEKGLEAPHAPILFLSAIRADDSLRKFIARCQPAIYLNKATDATPDRLAFRLEKVVNYLVQRAVRAS